eukprot:TRINITY_DN4909_c0_g1_i1.p1 TRINITY_DN4909_c0_g1~~TRINITY_DN4909_c0_g1_i1.p1  ORF type:complete len:130 (-),score=15.25 TRINITY_DN4909_c0_g1_i1:182-571(-)
MNAIVASHRLKLALRGIQSIPESTQISTQTPSNADNQITPMRKMAGEPLMLMIVIGNTNEEFEIEAFSSWNVAGLKELLSEVLKADPHDFAVSFKRTVLPDGQDLDKNSFLAVWFKRLICARLQEEKDN